MIEAGIAVVERGAWMYRPFQFDNEHQAIPSGHTVVIFALCTTLAERFESTPVSIGLYTLATVSRLALVYRGQHWFSDVFLGAAIGYLSGRFVCARERRREHDERSSIARVRFSAGPGGLSLVWRF